MKGINQNPDLIAGSGKGSDECLTPRYAVEPIVKYILAKGYKKVWCPFDKMDSKFPMTFCQHGIAAYSSHIQDPSGQDFFCDEHLDFVLNYQNIDCIVSNPPYSCKDKVLERLYKIGKPFAMLLPLRALQGSRVRVPLYINHGLELLCFDRRVNYYTKGNLSRWKPSNHFASAYFCKDVLPEKLIFEKLTPIQEPYK